MMLQTGENNKVYLAGEIAGEPVFSHEIYGEGFYEVRVRIPRLSGQEDVLPVSISERLMSETDMSIGAKFCAYGQFRSYNKLIGGRSKLMLTVFIKELLPEAEVGYAKNPNNIVLIGYICKPPVYRTTPFNREISDILVAVNRAYNKSDYIPCIAWGRNARFVKNLAVGEKVAISGRIQSREYQKRVSENECVTLTAYEVSVCKLSAYENVEAFDVEQEFIGKTDYFADSYTTIDN